MGGWWHEIPIIGIVLCLFQGKAEGVIDCPGSYFVVTHQPGKYRQSRGIRRGPAKWARLIVVHVPNRLARSIPVPVAAIRVVRLVEFAFRAVQHQHMSIAVVGIRPARAIGWIPFDGSGDWIRCYNHIALRCIVNYVDGHGGSRSGVYNDIWNTSVAGIVAKIGMQVPPGEPGSGDDRRRIWVDRSRYNVGVPYIGRWKRNKSIQACTVAK